MADFRAQRIKNEQERQLRLKSKSSSKKLKPSKTIVVYDSKGVVQQSNDPSRPVGTIDTSKIKESTANLRSYQQKESVSFIRNDANITRKVVKNGKVVSELLIQDKQTPRNMRKTPSEFAKQEGIIRSTARRTLGAPVYSTPKVQQTSVFGKEMSSRFDDKPVLTLGKLLRINKNSPTQSVDYQLFTNNSGQVIGVRDPFDGSSYRITPTSKKKVIQSFEEQQLEQDLMQKNALRPQVPTLTVERYKAPDPTILTKYSGLNKLTNTVNNLRNELRTARTRQYIAGSSYEKLALTSLKLWGATVLFSFLDAGRGYLELPSTAINIVKNPSLLKRIPEAIKNTVGDFGVLIRTSPDEAFIRIGAEVYLAKAIGSILDDLSRGGRRALAKFSTKFVGESLVGKTLKIKTATGKIAKLEIVGKIPKKTLKEQANLIGKKINAISSQANELIGFIQRSKVIKKPIPTELTFTKETKLLLKKFDSGKITTRQIKELNRRIIKEGSKGLLERGFFADPSGKIRPSRLGVLKNKMASFLDIYAGNVTFKRAKPQILFFENIQVEKLPKEFNNIIKKLKKGIKLTESESLALLEFQLKKSGKFKPIGFLTGESEVVLAPGEIIKRVKVIGKTIIKGEVVPIVQVKIVKTTGEVKQLLNKFRTGKLTPSEMRKLDAVLKRKTGLDYGLSKYTSGSKYVNIKSIFSHILISSVSRFKSNLLSYNKNISGKLSQSSYRQKGTSKKLTLKKYSKKATSPIKTSKRGKYPPSVSPTSKVLYTKSPKSSKTYSRSPKTSYKPPSKKNIKLIPKIPLKPKIKDLTWDTKLSKGRVRLVNVLIKSKGKIRELKLKTTPNRAYKYAKRLIDNTTSRSFQLKIVGVTKGKDIKSESFKKFRIKKSKGSKVLLLVEQSKYAIDTRGEKSGLTVAKALKRKAYRKPRRR